MASDKVKIVPTQAKDTESFDTVKTTTSPEDEDVDNAARVCGLCVKNVSKYTCPRCNTPYCTLDCYKSDKHRDCSEMFYKDCFMEGLKDCSVDPEEKRKVMEMLSRAENDPDLCDLEEVDDLEERLDDLDLERDTDQVWERLTDQEKKEFEHMVSDGRLGNLVEIWTPWWKEEVPVVTQMNQDQGQIGKPKIKSKIPNILDLTKLKPSSDTRYNLLNILYSYVYVCRLHNGDHVTMEAESAEDLMNLSDVLGQGQSFGSVRDAIQSCFSRLQSKQHGFESSLEENISVLTDIQNIIACPIKDNPLCYILTALSDLYEIFRSAYKTSSKLDVKEQSGSTKTVNGQGKEPHTQSKVTNGSPNQTSASILKTKMDTKKQLQVVKERRIIQDKKRLFLCKKKCEFMLSWAQSYGMSMQSVTAELGIEYSQMKGDLEMFNLTKRELEMKWGGRVKPRRGVLVEEL